MNDNVVKAKETFSKFGSSYLIMSLACNVVLLLIMALFKLITRGRLMTESGMYYTEFVIRFIVIYPLMYLMIKDIPKFEIPKKKLGVGQIIACAFMAYAIFYLTNLAGLAVNSAIGKLTGAGSVTPIADVFGLMNPVTILIIAVFIAPIYEELLFRKFLIDRVANYGEVTAMLISGVMFGLFHANFSQFVYAFTLGCFLAFIYLRTGNVIYTIIIHMIVNFIGSFVGTIITGNVDQNKVMELLSSGDTEAYMAYVNEHSAEMAAQGIWGFVVIGIVIVGVILLIIKRKKFVFENHSEEIQKSSRFSTSMLNTGMILYTIFFIAVIVVTQLGIDYFSMIAKALKLM